MATMAVGAYQTACEASPNKLQIDIWLNEGKPASWISRELSKQFGEKISDKAILKYRKYREEFIQKDLENDPLYKAKVQEVNQQLTDGIGKIRQVDVIAKLADIIDDSAEMLADAKMNGIQIRTAQDIRWTSQTMLDAIKLYGDTILKAQRFNAVENDPTLLKPTTINVNVKAVLTDVLTEAMNGGTGGYDLIDKLRNGIINANMDVDNGEENENNG